MAANILVFAGTAEGRELCTYLVEHGVPVTASVATAEGEAALIAVRGLTIHTGRLDQAAMRSFIRPFSLIVVATHPYAEQVTKLIRQTAEEEGIEVWRLVRPSSSQEEGTVVVPTVQAAITYLQEQKGNIFLTVGSKELPDFAENTVVWSRCFARVLPTPQAMTLCNDLGFSGSPVVAIHGPFSTALTLALLQETNDRFLVTHASVE